MQNDNLPTTEVDVNDGGDDDEDDDQTSMSHLLSYSCQGNFSVVTS